MVAVYRCMPGAVDLLQERAVVLLSWRAAGLLGALLRSAAAVGLPQLPATSFFLEPLSRCRLLRQVLVQDQCMLVLGPAKVPDQV